MTLCPCGGESTFMADMGGSALWQCKACGKPQVFPRQQARGRVERGGEVIEAVEAEGEVQP